MTKREHLPAARVTSQAPPLRDAEPLRPMNSIVAAAKQISSKKIRRSSTGNAGWQNDAWEAYGLVGEARFVALNVARAMSKARLLLAREPEPGEDVTFVGEDRNENDDPVPLTRIEEAAQQILGDFGGGVSGRQIMLQRMGIHLFVAGESFFVGLNEDDDPDQPPDSWHVLSGSEIQKRGNSGWTIDLGDRKREVDEDAAIVVRVWQAHPRKWWEPDSAIASNLPILAELIGLTKQVAASVDSRLAGAGMLVLPNSVSLAGGGTNEDELEDDEDPFVAELLEMMLTPIKDRESAAAVVPLVIRVPDDVVGQIQHLTFSQAFDPELRELRNEAIRRLALGLDAPPEVLLGLSDSNHWNAWQTDDNFVTLGVEPLLALVCDAITVGILRPALLEMGFPEEDVNALLCWFNSQELVGEPDRSEKAQSTYDRGELSGEALRRESGFDESDAPASTEDLDPAVTIAFDLVRAAPSLAQDPGLPALVAQIAAVIEGKVLDALPVAEEAVVEEGPVVEDEPVEDEIEEVEA